MESTLIELKDITKVYQMGQVAVHALRGVSLEVHPGEMLAIMGPSGSGKTTLMNILGCLDQPTAGTYLLDSKDISHLKDHQLAMIRSESIGFVFQTFNLLARTSALNNVMLPLLYAGIGRAERRDRARRALEIVGLADRMSHMPTELSGGQQQRVAIARALVNNPAIILADEPTGNLDSRSGQEIMAVMQTLNRERGITLVLVTHDATLAQHSQRIVYLHDGLITQDQIVDQPLVAAPSV